MRQIISTSSVHVLFAVSVSTQQPNKVFQSSGIEFVFYLIFPFLGHYFRLLDTRLLENSQKFQALDRQIFELLQTNVIERWKNVKQTVVRQQTIQRLIVRTFQEFNLAALWKIHFCCLLTRPVFWARENFFPSQKFLRFSSVSRQKHLLCSLEKHKLKIFTVFALNNCEKVRSN